MRTERRFRIAWKAYLAELVAMQMAEHPTEAAVRRPVALCEARERRRKPAVDLRAAKTALCIFTGYFWWAWARTRKR
jgi:hypothetical protein